MQKMPQILREMSGHLPRTKQENKLLIHFQHIPQNWLLNNGKMTYVLSHFHEKSSK
jgi:hypothetical protein